MSLRNSLKVFGACFFALFGSTDGDLEACGSCNSGPEKKGIEINFEWWFGNGINSFSVKTSIAGTVKPFPPKSTGCFILFTHPSDPPVPVYTARYKSPRPVEVEIDKQFSVALTAGNLGNDGQTEQVVQIAFYVPVCYGMQFGSTILTAEDKDLEGQWVTINGYNCFVEANSTDQDDVVAYLVSRSPTAEGELSTTLPCMLVTGKKKGGGSGSMARSGGSDPASFGANIGPSPVSQAENDEPAFAAEISLGSVSETEQLGSIYWMAETLADAALPSSLIYSSSGTASAGNDVITSSGDLRQVNSANGLVDILATTDELTINFYHAEDVGAVVSGLYTFSGDPFKTINITKSGSSVTYLIESDNTEVASYTLTTPTSEEYVIANTTLGRKDAFHFEEDVSGEKSETHHIYDTSGVSDELIFAQTKTYQTFDWGDELVEEINDPDGEARTTTHTFYGDDDGVTSSDAYYKKEKSVTYPDGSWVLHEYDSSGQIAKEYRPWKDSPSTAAAATGTTTRLTEYTYSSGKIASEITKILGVETNRDTYVYTTGTHSGSGAALNIETVTHTPAGGPETETVTRTFDASGKTESIDYEDGRRDFYIYEKGEYDAGEFTIDEEGECERTIVTHGTVEDPEGIANKTTREITIEDADGHTVSEETLVYTDEAEYERLNLTLHTYDEDGNLTETTKDGRVTYSATYYGDGKVETEADEQGIETEYTYSGNNITTSTKKGVASATIEGVTYAAQPDLVTTYEYDLLDRQVSEVVSSGSNSLPARTTTYTVVGDTESQSEGDFTTTYAYANGGRTITVIPPTGATTITDNYRDGQTKSITGTGVVHQFFDYGVNPEDEEDDYEDGTLWTEIRLADDESPRVEKTITDGSGRQLKIEKPTFDGTGQNVAEFEYNNKGQLIKESRTGLADTLYEYDELGRQNRTGLDMDASDSLTLASADRITDMEEQYWKEEEGAPWKVLSSHKSYFTENSSAYTYTFGREIQLNEFEDNMTANVDTYASVKNTISWEETYRDQKLVKQLTDTQDSDLDSCTVIRNGLIQSQSTPQVEKPVKLTYDGFGRQIGQTNPRTDVMTTTSYDAATGQIASVITGTGSGAPSTAYEYYPDNAAENSGKLKKLTQNGYATYYSWTPRGELYRQWGASYPVEYSYDDYGQLETIKTFQGPVDHNNPSPTVWTGTSWPVTTGTANVTTWEYHEPTGLLWEKLDAVNLGASYTWNDANQLLTRFWARGTTTTYTYNLAGELTGKTYTDSTPTVALTYNRRGLPATVTDGGGVRSRTYTVDGQLDQETYVSGVLPSGWLLDRNYGIGATAGKLRKLSLLAASTPVYSGSFTYTDKGTLASIRAPLTPGTPQLGYYRGSYTTFVEQKNFSGNFNYEIYYDDFDRLYTTWSDWFSAPSYYGGSSLQFNANSQASRRTFNDGDQYWDYSYNDHGELEDATFYLTSGFPSPSDYYQWHYDNIGNRFESLKDSALTTYDANSLNQYTEIETPGGTRDLLYDEDGNIIEDGKWAYTWDAENRLVSLQTSTIAISGGATPKKLVFAYDSENRRISKTVLGWSGTDFSVQTSHRLFLYDGMKMIAEVGFSGTTPVIAKSYYWGLDLAGWRDGQSQDGAGGIGGLWMIQSGTNAYYPMYDPMGNTLALAKVGTNEKVASYEYDPFGNLLSATGSAAGENPFRFSTKYYDEETGLIDFGYRFYNPETGRWLNRDPIGEDGGVSLYGYVENDPVNKMDILGLSTYVTGNNLEKMLYDGAVEALAQSMAPVMGWTPSVPPSNLERYGPSTLSLIEYYGGACSCVNDEAINPKKDKYVRTTIRAGIRSMAFPMFSKLECETKLKGKFVGYFHSHPGVNGGYPSNPDRDRVYNPRLPNGGVNPLFGLPSYIGQFLRWKTTSTLGALKIPLEYEYRIDKL